MDYHQFHLQYFLHLQACYVDEADELPLKNYEFQVVIFYADILKWPPSTHSFIIVFLEVTTRYFYFAVKLPM